MKSWNVTVRRSEVVVFRAAADDPTRAIETVMHDGGCVELSTNVTHAEVIAVDLMADEAEV